MMQVRATSYFASVLTAAWFILNAPASALAQDVPTPAPQSMGQSQNFGQEPAERPGDVPPLRRGPRSMRDAYEWGGPHSHPYHRRHDFGFSLLPAMYFLESTRFDPAFTSNGFRNPNDDVMGFSWLLWWGNDDDWRIGFGGGMLQSSEESGGFEAVYQQNHFGFYFGRDFVPGSRFDVTLGSLFAFGAAETEVFGPVSDGRMTEMNFMIEPRLTVSYRVGTFVKVGVTGSYLVPFDRSVRRVGDNLGISDLSPRGFSAGLELTFGALKDEEGTP